MCKRTAAVLWVVVVIMVALSGSALAGDQNQLATDKINLNTASAEMLTQLKGIGQAYAKRIIEYRETHGLFSHIEELKNVKGIGERIFEKNKHRITVEVETSKATKQ